MTPETRAGVRDLAWALLWCACPPALTVYGFWVVWRLGGFQRRKDGR